MRSTVSLLFCLATAVGCGEETKFAAGPAAVSSPQAVESAKPLPEGARGGAGGVTADAARNQAVERKIIYTISLDVIVTRFDDVPQQVERIVKEHPGAFVAEATLSGSTGHRRSGQWTIRVPQQAHEGFTTALRGLGEVRNENKRSEEVTEAFYDIAARLKNKKETESRLIKIQQERTGDLEQVLAAEREIGRVREEIERLQGQLNRLDNLTSLTTIKLSVSEMQSYQGEELDFSAKVGGVWRNSIRALVAFGERSALFLVSITPWLPIWIVLGLVGRVLWRWLFRRKPKPAALTASP